MDPAARDDPARDIDRTSRLTGSSTLRSGQTTREYLDKYLFESNPQLLRRVVEAMQPLVPPAPSFSEASGASGSRSPPCSAASPAPALAIVDTDIRAIDRGPSPAEALPDVGLTTVALLARADLDRPCQAQPTSLVPAANPTPDQGRSPAAPHRGTPGPALARGQLAELCPSRARRPWITTSRRSPGKDAASRRTPSCVEPRRSATR